MHDYVVNVTKQFLQYAEETGAINKVTNIL